MTAWSFFTLRWFFSQALRSVMCFCFLSVNQTQNRINRHIESSALQVWRITLRCRGFPSCFCQSEVCWRKFMGQLERFFNQGSSPGTSSRASKCRGWQWSRKGIIVRVYFNVKTPCLVAFLIRQQLCFSGISPVYCDVTPRASVFTGSCGEIRCHFDKEKKCVIQSTLR